MPPELQTRSARKGGASTIPSLPHPAGGRRAFIDAIHALGATIATTNYDDLLYRERGIAHIPWIDSAAVQEIMRGDREGVLHFHGCADHPKSVVLGVRSYQELLDHRGAQAVQQAIAANRTLLFIGCGGDGLSDPNFGALLGWSSEVFGSSIYRHYCLCRSSERKALEKQHPPAERLLYIEYGSEFDELAPFIHRELVPFAKSRTRMAILPSPGYCFGRKREVAEVVSALLANDPPPLPILGGPGTGKRRLRSRRYTIQAWRPASLRVAGLSAATVRRAAPSSPLPSPVPWAFRSRLTSSRP